MVNFSDDTYLELITVYDRQKPAKQKEVPGSLAGLNDMKAPRSLD